MKFKKYISLFLCLLMILSTVLLPSYASNESNSEIIVYLYSFTDESVAQNTNTKHYGGIKTGTVGCLVPNGKYTYQWFDPISGEYSEEHEFTATDFGTYYIGDRPHATDMVLYISAVGEF